ncbi:hypothetical protein [Flavivirga algicola]|uniref:Uncharacterized protein n=1 Tax=Flavivirga algicola TaxID=2729136 RepID=A0ABX1S0A3_9FLAO|nr:hypothetical protein [Flavivirga algicola]NMH88453.1 hypothetical protein [Flavivirga algicola]
MRFIFLRFKVNVKDDIVSQNPKRPVNEEISYVKDNKLITSIVDRSVLSEVFRVQRTNIDHHLRDESSDTLETGKVIYVITSTIKGEGKHIPLQI